MFFCKSGNIQVLGDTLLCLGKVEKYVSLQGCLVAQTKPVQTPPQGFCLAFLCIQIEGPERESSDPLIMAGSHYVFVLLFLGTGRLWGWESIPVDNPSAPSSPGRPKDLALPHSLFLRKRDTAFLVP